MLTTLLTFAGVAWLATLVPGPDTVRSLRSATRRQDTPAPRGRAGGYREGLLVNALNPKTALFMSALLP
ncbi:hypothetical protein [Actinophytocola sp. KF-1]